MKINKKITVAASVAIALLSGCQSTSTLDELKISEQIILDESNNVPVILDESSVPIIVNQRDVEIEKNKILTDGGFQSIKNLRLKSKDTDLIFNKNIISFDFDTSKLSDSDKKIIDNHIDFLKYNNMIKMIVEGHTDERGEKSYNLTLGEKRSNAVKKYMMLNGVASERVEIISYGETKPIATGDDKKAWGANRRAVFVYN
jgi:peptidoglycan-associated lipoprotein